MAKRLGEKSAETKEENWVGKSGKRKVVMKADQRAKRLDAKWVEKKARKKAAHLADQ